MPIRPEWRHLYRGPEYRARRELHHAETRATRKDAARPLLQGAA